MLWGILALLAVIVAFFPCLGALNWVTIPFAGIGLIISVVAVATGLPGRKGGGTAGAILCGVAIVLGFLRLVIGGGVV